MCIVSELGLEGSIDLNPAVNPLIIPFSGSFTNLTSLDGLLLLPLSLSDTPCTVKSGKKLVASLRQTSPSYSWGMAKPRELVGFFKITQLLDYRAEPII